MKSAAVRRLWFDRVERGERVEILTTEYTEAGEPILKDTEKISVYSVWERSDLSVYSVVKWGLGIRRVEHKEHKDFLGVVCVCAFTFHEK